MRFCLDAGKRKLWKPVATLEAESDGRTLPLPASRHQFNWDVAVYPFLSMRFSGMRPSKFNVKMLFFPPIMKKYISIFRAGTSWYQLVKEMDFVFKIKTSMIVLSSSCCAFSSFLYLGFFHPFNIFRYKNSYNPSSNMTSIHITNTRCQGFSQWGSNSKMSRNTSRCWREDWNCCMISRIHYSAWGWNQVGYTGRTYRDCADYIATSPWTSHIWVMLQK